MWTNYSQLDTETVVDEAQSTIYTEGGLRTREMMSSGVFTMLGYPQYSAFVPLTSIVPPDGSLFLEPIGTIFVPTFNIRVVHKDAGFVQNARTYTENIGTLPTNPFTTTANSTQVAVNLPSQALTQDSVFQTSGASAFNGVTIAGTFPISSIIDANNFYIDITQLGQVPNAAGSGGGSGIAYAADQLNFGQPNFFAIYDERINFEQSWYMQCNCRIQYYRGLPLLSSTNQTNFITARYPKLMRIACMAAAAEFMKDDTEYQKWIQRLQYACQKVNAENELQYRGMDLTADTP